MIIGILHRYVVHQDFVKRGEHCPVCLVASRLCEQQRRIADLRRKIADLRRKVLELQTENKALTEKIEELEKEVTYLWLIRPEAEDGEYEVFIAPDGLPAIREKR